MIGEAQSAMEYKRIDDSRAVLNQYSKYNECKVKKMQGSEILKRKKEVVI